MVHLDTPSGPRTACGISRVGRDTLVSLVESILLRRVRIRPDTLERDEPMDVCERCLRIETKTRPELFDICKTG